MNGFKISEVVVRTFLLDMVAALPMAFKVRCVFVAAAAGALLGLPALADPLLDFGYFDVPTQSQLAMKAPLVRWQVRADAQTACADAQPKDGYASRQEGCVYWHLSANLCTIVTTASTTHSQMGHLFLRCLQGK